MNDTNTESGTTSVVTASRVRMMENPVRVGAPSVTMAHGEPKIQLVRDDGTVRAIDITCGCGEKIRVWCDYS